MRCSRIASSSLLISLTLFLHASSVTPARAAKSSSNVIRVWTVGSPHTGALPPAVVPPDLRQRAESLGYTIEVETFRAIGFTGRFRQALKEHNEPEILAFDNYGVISGVRTANGWFEGIDSDRRMAPNLVLVHETLFSLQTRGWVMLVHPAVNYEAARTLSTPPAECDARSSRAEDPALRLAQEKAVFATRAYLDCDRPALAAVSDDSRLMQQCFMPQSNTKVEAVKACRVSGNQKLAFVSLVSGFSAQLRDSTGLLRSTVGMELGQQSIFAVLRNQNGNWRLLAITHDPMNTSQPRALTTSKGFLNSLDQEQPADLTPQSARLLMPDGMLPVPPKGERFGDFIWQPSESTDVIGQVAEFTWGKGTNYGLTRLFFLPASENKVSSGLLMNGGLSQWRVWSVSKSGDVAFSEQHSFRN
jgi:hypothetical protein